MTILDKRPTTEPQTATTHFDIERFRRGPIGRRRRLAIAACAVIATGAAAAPIGMVVAGPSQAWDLAYEQMSSAQRQQSDIFDKMMEFSQFAKPDRNGPPILLPDNLRLKVQHAADSNRFGRLKHRDFTYTYSPEAECHRIETDLYEKATEELGEIDGWLVNAIPNTNGFTVWLQREGAKFVRLSYDRTAEKFGDPITERPARSAVTPVSQISANVAGLP